MLFCKEDQKLILTLQKNKGKIKKSVKGIDMEDQKKERVKKFWRKKENLKKFFFLFLFESELKIYLFYILSIAKDKAKIKSILFDELTKELIKFQNS